MFDGNVLRVVGPVVGFRVDGPGSPPTGICGTVVAGCWFSLLSPADRKMIAATMAAIAISPTSTGTSQRLPLLSSLNALDPIGTGGRSRTKSPGPGGGGGWT